MSAPNRRNTRTVTRPLVPGLENPESLLRKRRKSVKATEPPLVLDPPQPLTKQALELLAKSIEASTHQEYSCSCFRSPVEYFDELSARSRSTDPEKHFYRKRGYLPPIDEEAVAIINAIIDDPTMAKDYARIGPEDEGYAGGLDDRNVSLEESTVPDPCEDTIILLKTQELLKVLRKGSPTNTSGTWTASTVWEDQKKHSFSERQ
jgi:hypothetical protein